MAGWSDLLEADRRISSRTYIRDKKTPARRTAEVLAHSADPLPWMVVIALLRLSDRPALRRKAALLGMGAALQWTVIYFLQHLIHRPRPDGNIDPSDRDANHTSFPSGHAARASVLTTIVLGDGPAWLGFLMAAWTLGVAWGRVAIGKHHWLDTLGGIVVGTSIGLGLLSLRDRLFAGPPSRDQKPAISRTSPAGPEVPSTSIREAEDLQMVPRG